MVTYGEDIRNYHLRTTDDLVLHTLLDHPIAVTDALSLLERLILSTKLEPFATDDQGRQWFKVDNLIVIMQDGKATLFGERN